MTRKVVIINLVVILILLVIVDLCVGLLYERVAPASGKLNIEILLGTINAETLKSIKPHPYMLWENAPDLGSGAGIKQTDKQGYRNERDIGTLEPGTLRILALGGSSTYGFTTLAGPAEAWPAQLEKKLNERLTGTQYQKVEVINAGLNYATSAELLSHYLFRDRYLGSKIVILHVGENDVVPMLFDDYDPEYKHFRPGWSTNVISLRQTERWLIRHSNIIKLAYAYRLRNSITLPHIETEAGFDKPEEYYLENVKRNQPIGFERNLELLIRNIMADGGQPVLFFPVLPSNEQYSAFSSEVAQRAAPRKVVRNAMMIGVEKDVMVMKTLSAKYGIPVIQISSDRMPTEYFFDHNHLTKEGEAIEGQIVADSISQLLQKSAQPTTVRH